MIEFRAFYFAYFDVYLGFMSPSDVILRPSLVLRIRLMWILQIILYAFFTQGWISMSRSFFYPPELSVHALTICLALITSLTVFILFSPYLKKIVPCFVVLHLNRCDDIGKSFGNYQFVQPLYIGIGTENYHVKIRITNPKFFTGVRRLGFCYFPFNEPCIRDG